MEVAIGIHNKQRDTMIINSSTHKPGQRSAQSQFLNSHVIPLKYRPTPIVIESAFLDAVLPRVLLMLRGTFIYVRYE